jgi:hypothetical protein
VLCCLSACCVDYSVAVCWSAAALLSTLEEVCYVYPLLSLWRYPKDRWLQAQSTAVTYLCFQCEWLSLLLAACCVGIRCCSCSLRWCCSAAVSVGPLVRVLTLQRPPAVAVRVLMLRYVCGTSCAQRALMASCAPGSICQVGVRSHPQARACLLNCVTALCVVGVATIL